MTLPEIYAIINLLASLGTALLAVWVGQQMVNERLLSAPMEVAHRIVIVIVALAFMVNAMQDRGPSGAFLAVACFVFFLLRVLARHSYPHGHRAVDKRYATSPPRPAGKPSSRPW